MNQVANQRALRAAVERLARIDAGVDDVSRAIDAFGQVLADLTNTPLRLAVIGDDAPAMAVIDRGVQGYLKFTETGVLDMSRYPDGTKLYALEDLK